MLKKTTLLMVAVIFATGLNAQKNYLNISVQAGQVINSQKDRKFGLGGSLAWLHQDNYMSQNENNYFSLTMKILNNPYGEGKFISSMFNNADDGFNYVSALLGYRFAFQSIENGVYIEPRLGYGHFAGHKSSLIISPQIGYTYNQFDFSAFCDFGFAKKPFITGKENFATIGLSVGYNIGL